MKRIGSVRKEVAEGSTRRTAIKKQPLHEQPPITAHRDVLYRAFAKLFASKCYSVLMAGGEIGLQIDDATRNEVRKMLMKGLGIDHSAASGIILDTEKMFMADWPDFKSMLVQRGGEVFDFAKGLINRDGRIKLLDQTVVLSRDDFLEHGEFKEGQERRFKELILYDALKANGVFGNLFYQGLKIHINEIAKENNLRV